MVPESFSFPKITYTLPNFAISPSLWRVSSVVYPAEEAQDHEERCRKIKSFSSVQNDDDQLKINRELCEERMDMLWEDFNEELQRVSHNNSSMDEKEKKSAERVILSNSENMGELCCVQDLNTSRTGSGMIFNNKRPSSSIVVVMKVLKKIFLLKNSSRVKKN